MIDDAEAILAELRDSPTDLARIVAEVLCRQPGTLYVARRTVEAWEARDPKAWATVRAWLEGRGVRLDVRPDSDDLCESCLTPILPGESVFLHGSRRLHPDCWLRLAPWGEQQRIQQAKDFIEAELRRIAESISPVP